MRKQKFNIFRGNTNEGKHVEYITEITEGMVVLDAIHKIQANQANDLACRWNCKAGKCGSCSVEINGKPKLACMTRMNEYDKNMETVIFERHEENKTLFDEYVFYTSSLIDVKLRRK